MNRARFLPSAEEFDALAKRLLHAFDNWSDRRFFITSLLSLTLANIYGFAVFGATFWYDSIEYLDLAQAIHFGTLRECFERQYFLYQHLGGGLPTLLAMLWPLPDILFIPVLAFIQRVVAIGATLLLMWALKPFMSRSVLLALAVFLHLSAFFSALHDAPLTESISASSATIVTAAGILYASGRLPWVGAVALMAIAGTVGTQFRSYLVLLPIGAITVLQFTPFAWRKLPWAIASAGLVLIGVIAFPAYRWAETGKLFLPNTGFLDLSYAIRSVPDLTETSATRLAALRGGVMFSAAELDRFDAFSNIAIAKDLLAKGKTEREVRMQLNAVAWSIKTQNAQAIVNQIRLPLASIGFVITSCIGPLSAKPTYRGYTAFGMCRHNLDHARWLAGLSAHSYLGDLMIFDTMYHERNNHPLAIARLENVLRPWLYQTPRFLRDPTFSFAFGLSFDLLAWLFAASCVWLARVRQQYVMVALLVIPVFVNYVVCGVVPLGNPRYSYMLFPAYVLVSGVLVAPALRRLPALRAWATRQSAAIVRAAEKFRRWR